MQFKYLTKAIYIMQASLLVSSPVLYAQPRPHSGGENVSADKSRDCGLDNELRALGSAMLDLTLEAKVSAPAEYSKLLKAAKEVKPGILLTDSSISARAALESSGLHAAYVFYGGLLGVGVANLVTDSFIKNSKLATSSHISGGVGGIVILGSIPAIMFEQDSKDFFNKPKNELEAQRKKVIEEKINSFFKDESKFNEFIEALIKNTEPLYNALTLSQKEEFKLSIKNELSLSILEKRDPDISKVLKRYYDANRLSAWEQVVPDAVSLNETFATESYKKLGCASKKAIFRAGIQELIASIKSSQGYANNPVLKTRLAKYETLVFEKTKK